MTDNQIRETFIIRVPQIKIFGYHGCYDKEKKEGQEFDVGVEIVLGREYYDDMQDIKDTFDYTEIVEKIRSGFKEKRCDIIEELAKNIGNELLDYWPRVELVKVKIKKYNPQGMNIPYVEVEFISDYK